MVRCEDREFLDYMIRRQNRYKVPVTKHSILDFDAHYSDPRFQGGKEETLFGSRRDGLNYVYSDRLVQWDSRKDRWAWEIASKEYPQNSVAHRERYLSEYFGKPCTIEHVVVGVNVSNRYPYAVYGYTLKEPDEPGSTDQSPSP
jgi:hypothetical protein